MRVAVPCLPLERGHAVTAVLANFLGSLALIALITTLILPGRQTVPVINAGSRFVGGSLTAAMGGGFR